MPGFVVLVCCVAIVSVVAVEGKVLVVGVGVEGDVMVDNRVDVFVVATVELDVIVVIVFVVGA